MAARGFSDDDVPPLDAPMRVRNPLMAAAARLLALAAAVQADRQVADVARLRTRADGEAKAFEKTLAGLGLSSEDNARARYAVLATVDDIVQNLPGGANSDWPRRSLVVVSFGQAFGGDQFFTILDTLLQRPAAHLEMLELYHACLAVGFMGRLRTLPDGQAQVAARMGAIHNQLTSIRPRPETDLVPAWTGVPTPMPRLGWLVRAAIVAAGCLAAILLLFLGAKLLLDSRDHPAFVALRQVPPVTPARIDRVGGDVVKPSGQLERVRGRLTSKCIEAKDDGATIRLVIAACPGLPPGMFDKGAADIDRAYEPLIVEAGNALKPESGQVAVVAHTDSDPIRGALAATYADNLELSQARAASVQSLLVPVLGANRLTAQGRGDREPVDRGDTPEAKAKNRRVELILPRSE
ncbi:MAG: type IVB secretion system protein IcmH/DotU [Sphingomonadaceae bacterium]|nr:type IVB secretion system protein IcmH/DotU [Sphingomonadaceae bacterium]